MSMYLKRLIEKRRQEHEQRQAEQERQKEKRRHELRAEREKERRRLARYTIRTSRERRAKADRLRAELAAAYWPWWRCVDVAGRQEKEWRLCDLMRVFANAPGMSDRPSRPMLAAFLKAQGWQIARRSVGNFWRSPEHRLAAPWWERQAAGRQGEISEAR